MESRRFGRLGYEFTEYGVKARLARWHLRLARDHGFVRREAQSFFLRYPWREAIDGYSVSYRKVHSIMS